MDFLDLQRHSLLVVLGLFAAAAVVVWVAGTRIAGHANTIAEKTGIGKAFAGLLLLGGITSLPELVVTVTSSLEGRAELAVNNLLGGVSMQVAILAAADAVYGRKAISGVVAHPVVQLQGILCVLVLCVIAVGIVAGDVAALGVGLWAALAFVVAGAGIWIVKSYEGAPAWVPRKKPPVVPAPAGAEDAAAEARKAPLARTGAMMALAALAILVAGVVLSRAGDAIAEKTGLGQSFVGAVLVAVSTSLPEVSTVVAVVRIGQKEMAFSDIFGTNLFDLGMVVLVDVAYRGGPILREVGSFSAVAALIGITVTSIYVAGLIERKDRAFARMGVDSILVLLVYLGGLVLLYRLR